MALVVGPLWLHDIIYVRQRSWASSMLCHRTASLDSTKSHRGIGWWNRSTTPLTFGTLLRPAGTRASFLRRGAFPLARTRVRQWIKSSFHLSTDTDGVYFRHDQRLTVPCELTHNQLVLARCDHDESQLDPKSAGNVSTMMVLGLLDREHTSREAVLTWVGLGVGCVVFSTWWPADPRTVEPGQARPNYVWSAPPNAPKKNLRLRRPRRCCMPHRTRTIHAAAFRWNHPALPSDGI
jgi:hypothetical protein